MDKTADNIEQSEEPLEIVFPLDEVAEMQEYFNIEQSEEPLR